MTFIVDATDGRLGDGLMRLVGLYVAADFHRVHIEVRPHPLLVGIATTLFSDRLKIVGASTETPTYSFSSRGLLNLLRRRGGGTPVAPYHRTVLWSAQQNSFRVNAKALLVLILDTLRLVLAPPSQLKEKYHGFAEALSIPPLRTRNVSDLEAICSALIPRLQKALSEPIAVPKNGKPLAVFPSGTSQQFMPASWAARHLPQALFCFHKTDERRVAFEKLHLQVISFTTPEDILSIARGASWSIATDSFPSHLLQLMTNRLTVCLTRERSSRVVVPGFGGVVVESMAECSPCAGPTPDSRRCRAGLFECKTWGNSDYTDRVLQSVPVYALSHIEG